MPSFVKRISLALLALAIVGPAVAQTDRPAYRRALAAGYVASFTCSNWFNGGLTPEQTRADDLRGTYAELQPLLRELQPELDRAKRLVRVRYDPDMPPRIAAWRIYLGCSLLPIGADEKTAAALPSIGADAPTFVDFDDQPWPKGDRDATAPARGDVAALARATGNAFDRRIYGQGSETTAVLVVQDGKIVAERYRPDINMHTSQRTWSVAKSLAGTVIGAAVQQGLISLNAPAPVPEWQRGGDPRAAITLEQLLRMSSGLHSDFAGNTTHDLYFGGVAVKDQIAGWPLAARPGSVFRYANNDIVAAMRALEHRLGRDAMLFPFRALLWKLGMTRTVPETDWRGTFIMSSQVWTTARDLARLGILHLNDGVWNGERILPEGWNDLIRRHGPAQPERGFGYGLTWWTFPPDSNVPSDAFVAQGNRGQYLAVIPSLRLVVVRRGFDGTGQGFDIAAFTRDVAQALGRRP